MGRDNEHLVGKIQEMVSTVRVIVSGAIWRPRERSLATGVLGPH